MREVKAFNRRSFLGTVTGGSLITGALWALASSAARAGIYEPRTQNDVIPQGSRSPQNRTQPYTGCSDRDSGDSANYGRSCRSGGGGGSAGVTDNDPNDVRGHGRGSGGGGTTDNDPNDPRGHGRGSGGTGVTDADPNDVRGQGRGR